MVDPRQNLRQYADEHGISWTGSVKLDGEFWRAKLEFSDRNVVYHGTGRTQEEAIERAISFAISARDAPQRPENGPINLRDGR
jgi:hypothetical protein